MAQSFLTRKIPRVVAHRGASDVSPEHTLAAYRRAVEAGADGLECDIRLTSDGHLVCVHDRRIDRTSNGRGVLSTMSLRELEAFDWGSWKNPWADLDDEAELPDPQTVLTLDTLLATVRDAGRPLELAIETKHPTRYAGLVEQQVVRLLRRFALADPADPASSRVGVMSFSALGLRRIRLLAPSLPTVLLLDRLPMTRRDGSLPVGVGIAGPGVHLLRAQPDYVARAHGRGHRVYVWTVNDPDDLELALSLGVDAIITDRPTDVLVRLGRTSAPR
jgi:glycerophosphoryl diester phosphodiesterase